MHPFSIHRVFRQILITMKQSRTIMLLLAFLVSVTAYGQKTINREFDGVESIRMSTASGNGTFKKGTGKTVKVTLEYTYDDDEYEPVFDQRGSRLVIEEDFSNRNRRWSRGKAEWTIEVPDGLRVDFSTGSGNIDVIDVDMELYAKSGSGNLYVEKVKGDVDVSTGSGNISVEDLEGEVDANTGSGNIRVRNTVGDADMNTGSGEVRVSGLEGSLDLNTGSGNIEAYDLKVTGNSSFNTGSGNAEISLAGPLNDDISINTGSGNAELDFNGQKIEGDFRLESNSKNSITAPFRFDKEYEEDNGGGWRGRNKRYVKEARIGSKDVRITMGTGSGNVRVKK